jgi:acyl-CoA synthetase (AMP-forming)/AMP-acid ligase II
MDFTLSEFEGELLDLGRTYAEREIAAVAAVAWHEERCPTEVLRGLGELGLLGTLVPEKWGGIGSSTVGYVALLEALAAVDPSVAAAWQAHSTIGSLPLLLFGDDDQRERWLRPLAEGRKLGAFGLTELGKFSTSSVRFITGGGEKMPVTLIERLLAAFPNARFADAYGLTETVSGDTFNDQAHTLSKIGSVGKPVLNLDLRIGGPDDVPVEPGQAGEVLLRGPKVVAGYWNNPEATAAAFTPDGWFRTGDIGHLDCDGYLYIDDRKKDMIVSGGENVATSEVERVIYEHDAVLEAAVVAMPDARWGEVPRAFIVLKPGQDTRDITAEALIAHCRSRLAGFKTPKEIVFLDALPRNPSGKVLKRELREINLHAEG